MIGRPVTAAGQTPLPLGTPEQGKVSSDAPAEYTVVAKTAGLLGGAIRGDGDLAFAVTDEDGQTLPDGAVDRDLNGSEGTEMVLLLIAEAGTYQVRVRQARSIAVGKPHDDSLNSEAGDSWDWFVLKPAQAGTLAIVTRRVGDGDSDLVLEVYTDGDFGKPADRSDQDLQGNNANESVTVNVNAGQAVHGAPSQKITGCPIESPMASRLLIHAASLEHGAP